MIFVTTPPSPSEYVIVAVPGAPPITTPVAMSIVAMPGALLDHVPPLVPFVSVIFSPTQTSSGPPIEEGAANTVTTTQVAHPATV